MQYVVKTYHKNAVGKICLLAQLCPYENYGAQGQSQLTPKLQCKLIHNFLLVPLIHLHIVVIIACYY